MTSVSIGEQFQLQALLVLSAPAGVQPFAGFVDLRFSSTLVLPVNDSTNVGLAFSNTSSGLIDEAGRIMYDPSNGDFSTLIFSKTFTAKKKGLALFESDAADLYGHEFTVLGLNEVLPWSQITFGSTTLEIKGR